MSKPIATVECHCGRMCLMVAGLVLAVETDRCADVHWPADQTWKPVMLEEAAKRINEVNGKRS